MFSGHKKNPGHYPRVSNNKKQTLWTNTIS